MNNTMNIYYQPLYIYFSKQKIFIYYVIIGGISASLDFIFYSLFIHVLGIDYLISNVISVNIGILNSFIINRKYNFKVLNKRIQRLTIFYAVGISGLLLSSYLLWFFVENMQMDKTIVKLITIPIIVVFQFTMNKLFTFKVHN